MSANTPGHGPVRLQGELNVPSVPEKHRAINNRPKRCPTCGLVVQASNLARHIRLEAERYRRTA